VEGAKDATLRLPSECGFSEDWGLIIITTR